MPLPQNKTTSTKIDPITLATFPDTLQFPNVITDFRATSVLKLCEQTFLTIHGKFAKCHVMSLSFFGKQIKPSKKLSSAE